jgi:hypothetical protein
VARARHVHHERGGKVTTVYVAMINDRHADPEPKVFSTAEAAINYARSWAQDHALHPSDFAESDVEDWLYYASYSASEGDSVWVVERTIDAP